jgi:hypothetical protein
VESERASGGVTGFLKRAVREPLVHFLAIGAVLFVANAMIHGPGDGPANDRIVISEGRVGQIAESFRLLSGRLPTRDELEMLVDDYVSEEVGYREAVAMGLDADDTIVRRRMRQKLEFLIEDAAASDEPAESELQGWLDAHKDEYRLPERRAFRQVLASADRRGTSARNDAEAFLVKLKSGADPDKQGDGSMLPAAMPLTTEEGVAGLFGGDFARAAFSHDKGAWFGPIASPFGEHLILVVDVEQGRAVSLAEVRDKVRADWIENKRNDARDKFHASLRKRYDIHIEWPDPWKGLPETPNPAPKTKPIPEVGE